MTTFSIINPSDCFTMEADDLKVAQMATNILGGGMYGLSQGGQTVLGIPQTAEWLKENFGNHTAWLDAHIDALIAALDSVKLDGVRSSVNCIDKSAQRFAQQLRERKEARGCDPFPAWPNCVCPEVQ